MDLGSLSAPSISVSTPRWPAANRAPIEATVAVPSEAQRQAPDDKTLAADASSDSSNNDAADKRSENPTGPTRADGTPLSDEEVQLLDQLKQTDREVRQHEMAHQAVGGAHTGGVSYEYEVGPDGKRYAVAGEVSVDYGPVPGDPQATIEKMQTVIAAAMAPADPSPKDIQIAAQARQYLLEAKLEAAREANEMNQARESGLTRVDGDEASDTAAPEQAA